VALEIPADEAVVGDAELQGGRAGVVDASGAVLLGEREDAEDAADARLAVATMERFSFSAGSQASSAASLSLECGSPAGITRYASNACAFRVRRRRSGPCPIRA
jgi:hypothetical protein